MRREGQGELPGGKRLQLDVVYFSLLNTATLFVSDTG